MRPKKFASDNENIVIKQINEDIENKKPRLGEKKEASALKILVGWFRIDRANEGREGSLGPG